MKAAPGIDSLTLQAAVLPDEMSGYQVMAWICWRSRRAVDTFDRPEAHRLWENVKRGIYPRDLGRPTHFSPKEAEAGIHKVLDDMRPE